MRQRYVLIEPKYSDPDTFCCFIVGSDQVRAAVQIYADLWMLREVAAALSASTLENESPMPPAYEDDDSVYAFDVSVLPRDGGRRRLRFRIYQDLLDDGAPFRADVRLDLKPGEAEEFARDLERWCAKPEYTFDWKGN